jgi:hypothetical protein
MEDSLQQFKKFAEERLDNHIRELSTQYDRRVMSEELMRQAYNAHQKIYSTEMETKIRSIILSDNPWLEGELENLKRQFEQNLVFKNK